MPDVPLVAAFDVDGTLTTRDCVVPFLRRVAGTAGLVTGLARRSHPARCRPLVGRDRDRLKELATRVVFAGRPADEVDDAGRRFAAHVAASWLRDDIVGDAASTIGATATTSSSCRRPTRRISFPSPPSSGTSSVIGTRAGVGADGTCTGELDGGNCRGAAKVVRLHRWLDERFGGRRNVTLWAYGDSAGDEAMLADADHAVWVGR